MGIDKYGCFMQMYVYYYWNHSQHSVRESLSPAQSRHSSVHDLLNSESLQLLHLIKLPLAVLTPHTLILWLPYTTPNCFQTLCALTCEYLPLDLPTILLLRTS